MDNTKETQKQGLFIVSFEIGEEMPGAPLLNLNLSVYTPEEKVTGIGHITQAVNPPMNVATEVRGDYTYMCVMPDKCNILVTATGYPVITWPKHGGVGPVIMPNFEIRMVIDENWRTGTANYKYIDPQGNWREMKNQPVNFATPKHLAGE